MWVALPEMLIESAADEIKSTLRKEQILNSNYTPIV